MIVEQVQIHLSSTACDKSVFFKTSGGAIHHFNYSYIDKDGDIFFLERKADIPTDAINMHGKTPQEAKLANESFMKMKKIIPPNLNHKAALYALGFVQARFIQFEAQVTEADRRYFSDLYDFLMQLDDK